MKIYRFYSVLLVLIIFIISFNNLHAQDNIAKIYEELSKNLKFSFEDNNFKYRSLIFETSSKIDDKYDVKLKANIFVLIDNKKTFPLEIHRFKSEAQTYYTAFTFTKNKYNRLFINDTYDLDLGDESIKRLQVTDPNNMISTLFIYFTKKELESLNIVNAGIKYEQIKSQLKILKNYENNPYYYETMAYLNIFKDTIYNVNDVSGFFDKSKKLGNTDCIFLKNYSTWNYNLADSLYKLGGSEEMDKLSVKLLEKVINNNSANCTIDSTLLFNAKYMLAYCLYNIYISQNIDNLEKLTEIERLLKDVSEKKDDIKRRNKSLLLLGNVYDLKGEYTKAIEKYEEILKGIDLDEQIKNLAEEYLEEVKAKVTQ